MSRGPREAAWLAAHAGAYTLLPSPKEVLFLRAEGATRNARLAGELRTAGAICDIISFVAQSTWSGELMVLGADETVRSIFFELGNVVGAQTNVLAERLGEILYRFGKVTRAQLRTAVHEATHTKKHLGETALALGLVSSEELYPMMARQFEEVFYKTMQISEGAFYFFDHFDSEELSRLHVPGFLINMNTGGMLMEGARRMDEMSFFREKVPSEHCIPAPAQTAYGRKPPSDLADVYAQCTGTRSLFEIGRRLGQLEFEVTKAVFQLLSGGLVVLLPPRPRERELVAIFNRALSEIHAVCDRNEKGEKLREGLRRFVGRTQTLTNLLEGAGPLSDGTLDPAKVTDNARRLSPDDPDPWLSQELYEYTGFALFQAGSVLPREVASGLNLGVGDLLRPLKEAGNSRADPKGRP